MQFSAAIDKIAPAFLAAQMELKKAPKDHENSHFKSRYADLTSVYDACAAALHNHGISIVQGARSELDTYGIDMMLLHSSGQWFREVLMLKPTKGDPQGSGSAITYARRYTLAAMVGVMQDDDDGNAASEGSSHVKVDLKELAKSSSSNGPTSPRYVPIPSTRTIDNPGEYVIPFGKYKGRKMREVTEADLNSYCLYITKTNEGKPMSKPVGEFMAAAEAYLLASPDVMPEVRNVGPDMDNIPF